MHEVCYRILKTVLEIFNCIEVQEVYRMYNMSIYHLISDVIKCLIASSGLRLPAKCVIN